MAFRALSIAATGGRAMMDRIDAIARNLANAATPAYKKTRTNFADLLDQEVQGAGVRLASVEKLFHPGALRKTGRDLDLAIDGEGFFRLRLPDGAVAYTRDGRLDLDAEGRLVTSDGHRLDAPFRIPGTVTRLSVDPSGVVEALDPATGRPDALGRIGLARFVNPSGLEAVGGALYRETPASGHPVNGIGRIRQGFLEESNVDAVQEMVELLSALRAFEINAKCIETADQVLQTLNALRLRR